MFRYCIVVAIAISIAVTVPIGAKAQNYSINSVSIFAVNTDTHNAGGSTAYYTVMNGGYVYAEGDSSGGAASAADVDVTFSFTLNQIGGGTPSPAGYVQANDTADGSGTSTTGATFSATSGYT